MDKRTDCLFSVSMQYCDELQKLFYLRRHIFHRKASTTARDDEIDTRRAIRPLCHCALDFEHIVPHNLGLSNVPLIITVFLEDFFQGWYALVRRGITGGSL